MYKFKKKENYFLIIKNNKEIITPNKNVFIVHSKKMAIYIISELNKYKVFEQSKTPIASLAFFASNLSKKDRINIIKYLIKMIHFDNVLYSTNVNDNLKREMHKNYYKYILEFENFFSLNFQIIFSTVGKQKKQDTNFFLNYINSIDNFALSLFYKLVQYSKSVILSYFFLEKDFSINKFSNLCNLENIFQQRLWGMTDEQKLVDDESKKNLKNYSIFLKLLN